MPWFIKTCERKTYTKYLVEAESAAEAQGKDGQYIGYVDGDEDGVDVSEAFETKTDASDSFAAYTEGR